MNSDLRPCCIYVRIKEELEYQVQNGVPNEIIEKLNILDR